MSEIDGLQFQELRELAEESERVSVPAGVILALLDARDELIDLRGAERALAESLRRAGARAERALREWRPPRTEAEGLRGVLERIVEDAERGKAWADSWRTSDE